jgi:hypothetical protein
MCVFVLCLVGVAPLSVLWCSHKPTHTHAHTHTHTHLHTHTGTYGAGVERGVPSLIPGQFDGDTAIKIEISGTSKPTDRVVMTSGVPRVDDDSGYTIEFWLELRYVCVFVRVCRCVCVCVCVCV